MGEWKRYPENKPKWTGNYITTLGRRMANSKIVDPQWICESIYSSEREEWIQPGCRDCRRVISGEVLAFMEFPEMFRGEPEDESQS